MADARVLVTGAAGFLGRTVCPRLAACGFTVRAMTRSGAAPQDSYERVVADLADPVSLARAVQNVDAVVHLAARVHVMRESASDPLAAFRRVNVTGTAALLNAAQTAGVRRFIFISSVKAVGEKSALPMNAATACEPLDPYGVSKLEAEALVRAANDPGGLRTTTLRLPLSFGPGMGGNMLRLFDWVSRKRPAPFGRVANARSIVYSGNVAAAICHVLRMDSPPGGPFFVSDAKDLSTPELMRLIADSLGTDLCMLAIPSVLLRALTGAMRRAARIGMPDASPTLDRLLGSLRVDSRELTQQTGFIPPFSTADGMRETAKWYQLRQRTQAW